MALTKPGELFGRRHEAGVRKEGHILEEAQRGWPASPSRAHRRICQPRPQYLHCEILVAVAQTSESQHLLAGGFGTMRRLVTEEVMTHLEGCPSDRPPELLGVSLRACWLDKRGHLVIFSG